MGKSSTFRKFHQKIIVLKNAIWFFSYKGISCRQKSHFPHLREFRAWVQSSKGTPTEGILPFRTLANPAPPQSTNADAHRHAHRHAPTRVRTIVQPRPEALSPRREYVSSCSHDQRHSRPDESTPHRAATTSGTLAPTRVRPIVQPRPEAMGRSRPGRRGIPHRLRRARPGRPHIPKRGPP